MYNLAPLTLGNSAIGHLAVFMYIARSVPPSIILSDLIYRYRPSGTSTVFHLTWLRRFAQLKFKEAKTKKSKFLGVAIIVYSPACINAIHI